MSMVRNTLNCKQVNLFPTELYVQINHTQNPNRNLVDLVKVLMFIGGEN